MRRVFRPFGGPWPIQFLGTVFFAPTILFGKHDLSWLRCNDEIPCLRITAFVPREFWVDIHFGCSTDYLAVLDAIEPLWAPSTALDRETSRGFSFIKKWWRLSGIVIFLLPFFAADTATDGIPWVAIGSFLLWAYIMLVEVVTSRNDCPPERIDPDE
jgi:hypothetical protein